MPKYSNFPHPFCYIWNMTDETMISQLTKIGDERIRIEADPKSGDTAFIPVDGSLWQETRKEARDAHSHT